MGRETVLFRNEEKVSLKHAADFLRQLADKLDTGKVVLQQGNNQIKLKIPQNVELEIKAEKEVGKRKTKKKLEVEIEWVVGDKEAQPFSLG